MRPSLYTVIALLIPWRAFANPCVLEYVAGRNPMAAAPQKDIYIAHETIRIDLRGKRVGGDEHLLGTVRVGYEFDNRGPTADVLVGFPIGRYTDRFYPSRDIVGGFQVKGAGAGPLLPKDAAQQIAIERTGIKACEKQNAGRTLGEDAAGYAWFLWQQTFLPGRNRLEIRYDLHLLSDRDSDSTVAIDYVLSTTAGWGNGRIGKLAIDFRVRGVPRAWKAAKGIPAEARPRPGNHLRWSASDFTPAEDLRFAHLYSGEEAMDETPTRSELKLAPDKPKARAVKRPLKR
jgi:hypothetical protein